MKRKAVKLSEYLLLVILALIFLYISFRNLGAAEVANSDEARHGVSAYEMLQTGNWIENTFNYEKDLWNLKPPVSFWAEAASMRIFGYSIWAFRFPSVIAFMTIFFMVCFFLLKKYNMLTCAFFMMLFIAFDDFFFAHFGRAGDADAIYGLFYILSLLCLYEYGTVDGKVNRLYLSGFFAAMAFLTKSFHAMVLYLILTIYVLALSKKKQLKWKNVLAAIVCALLPIALWGAWRYSFDGMTFLGSMFSTDVTERVSGSKKNPLEYARWLGTIVFYWMPRIYVAVLGSSLFVLLRERILPDREKNAILFWGLSLGTPLVVYTCSFAKANWYFLPFMITLCMSASIALGRAIPVVLSGLTGKQRHRLVIRKFFYGLILLLWISVFGYSSLNIGRNIKKADELQLSDVQTALRDLPGDGRNTEYGGLCAYIYKPDVSEGLPEQWEQADLFVAELYNDYHCKEGGISAFLETEGAVLYIPKDMQRRDPRLSECILVAENEEYVVLFHGAPSSALLS